MFPFCLINASVTDAEGIRSRLVSFPSSLFFPVFATLPFQWSFFKKQTGSAFPSCFSQYRCFFFFCCCFFFLRCFHQTRLYKSAAWPRLDKLKCQTAQPGAVKQKLFPPAWCVRFHFTAPELCVLLSKAWLISSPLLTWLISVAGRIQEVTFLSLFFFFKLNLPIGRDHFWVDSGICLVT